MIRLWDFLADDDPTTRHGRLLVAVTAQYREGHSPEDVALIVTDVNMPVLSGLELFKGVRAAQWRTPVVPITGMDTPDVHDLAQKLGAAVMLKPLDLSAFESIVRRLVTEPTTSSSCTSTQ